MTRSLIVFAVAVLTAAPAAAQGRNRAQGVPPGQLPPAGQCRVWYDGVPPGRQPAPTRNCDEAERIASRDRNARVLYGHGRTRNNTDRRNTDIYGGWDPRDDRRNDRVGNDDGRRRQGPVTGRAVPRGEQYPGSVYPDSRYPSQRNGNYGSVAFRQGYQDGVEKAREDTRDGDKYDPARHGWYKSANRGYDSRYGSREQYAAEYRDGFLDGYREAYRGRSDDRGGWWPF